VSEKKPPRPFLDEAELASELDAWDATFDALHVADEAAQAPAQPPMQWPPPSPAAERSAHARVPEPALTSPDAAHTLEEALPPIHEDLDSQMTLDRARWQAPATETDFSNVGAHGEPAALGEMLGSSSGDLPAMDEDVATSLIPPDQAPTFDDEDDGVYTSASRPNVPSLFGHTPPPEDPLVPPPTPARPPPRRTAAIIRRTPEGVPAQRMTPAAGHAVLPDDASAFGESTKIADAAEIEARAQQTRGHDRSKAPTAPPPLSFTPSYEEAAPEEDEYEIEIGAEEAGGVPEPAAPVVSAPRRTVAHVVRRTEAMKAVQPVPRPISEPTIDVETAEPEPVSEDDFSDVAAAVGANDDDMVSRRRPSIPDGDDLAIPVAEGLDQALSGLDEEPAHIDDHMATIALDDEQVVSEQDAGDAYVPLMSDSLELPQMPQIIDDDPQLKTTVARDRSSRVSNRPPSIVDLYPRVKTPTSVPPLAEHVAPRRAQTPIPVAIGDEPPEIEPTIDLEAIQLPEQVQPLASSELDEDAAAALIVYEREIATVDDSAASAALRVEAGRLCERLGDIDRARSHYDAALLVDPRATTALRGLRRIARASSDLVEATRQLDAELAVAGALERRPLGHYRVDLLLASGEHDLARVAVGELLDTAPSDVRALLAQLELAFLDGRADEFGKALEQLAHAVSDNELRAAVQTARAMLAAHHDDPAAAAAWFAAAAESDPGSLAARLGAVRNQVRAGDGAAAASALLDLAQQMTESDPTTAAAFAIRAQYWTGGEHAAQAAKLASEALPADPLVARVSAQTALARAGEDPAAAGAALAAWASCPATPAERAYAAARAAELDPGQGAELWATALRYDPGDDYAAAQLRTAHVAAEAPQLAIEVDLAVAADVERDRARLRAAFGMIAQGQLDVAIELLERARHERPGSLALAEALAEALAAGGKWTARAQLLGELAANPGDQLDKDVARLRSALAWEEAVGGAAEVNDAEEVQRATAAALDAWGKVLERDSTSPTGHAAAIVLAARLGDRDVLAEVLTRAQEAERSPWAASSLGLRRARLAADDAARTEALAKSPSIDDPRRSVMLMVAAARRGELAEAATALEERASQLDTGSEAAVLRLRAAQLALDAGDAPRATALLGRVERALPSLGIIRDLLAAARRRAGDRDRSGPVARLPDGVDTLGSADAFAQLVRDADLAASQNDGAGALALYQRALELHPGDPLAALPMVRLATMVREPAPIAALALAQLRAAEAAGDGTAKAEAYELLAQIDKELRGDPGSAQIALESASQADPTRIDLMHRLEREYTVTDQLGELLRLRRAEVDQIPNELARDRAAMIMDTASLAEREGRPDVETSELYRSALAADPRHRLALLQLESNVRRTGASHELAQLEAQIAEYFEGDARTQASFYTRAGETLAELGSIDSAVQHFGKAETAQPGHVPALEAWRGAALKGQLWLDAADAATRQAAAAPISSVPGEAGEQRGALHHFAGVVLMDKALNGEGAMAAFHRALEADPGHRDAFLRLRILLEEDARHDELAILLAQRVEHENDDHARLELHRALAKLLRDFVGDRDGAKKHYRAILDADANDLRALAAVADISWEQGAWQEAADALIARAKLEKDPEILKTLCFRLGLIYADRLVDVPMALKAFQRALTYQPDDEATLVRLADLATQAGEWKLALGACERLVKSEKDPDKRSSHLGRVAKIFRQGFGDMKRAERALNLALDGSPTNDEALSQLVQFYRDSGDMVSVRVHLNRVAGTMRVRAASDPRDGVAYRVVARAMAARGAAGVDGSLPIARAAAELATLLGAAGDPERLLLAEHSRVDLSLLLRPEADEVLFPRSIQPELRQVFVLLGDRIAKHVGVDLRAYGVGRGDRLRAKDGGVAAHAQDVATALGFGDIDVYVSARQPYAMIAEPTSPVSLVLGQTIAQGDARGIRFAAGSALKLAQSSLAIPARLGPEELGVLVVSLLRLFQPDFPIGRLDEGAVATQMQKLKRLIPSGLNNEIKPYALGVDAGHFSYFELARDLRIAGLRAGLVAAGSLMAGLNILAAQSSTDVPSFLADPVAQGLVSFALAEDHATVAR
jgi:tetratricopeptide (TPR) repeat protein